MSLDTKMMEIVRTIFNICELYWILREHTLQCKADLQELQMP